MPKDLILGEVVDVKAHRLLPFSDRCPCSYLLIGLVSVRWDLVAVGSHTPLQQAPD
jgi:hypothetical protein